ncbi:MAG: hypothetical protein E7181_01380 [Erysipelotrichaceae bacterium]|nr:hypothetical protein [Erysipelotrichaceae bacterium]
MFKKRETLTQNIAYMGLMAAINVIFVLLTYFVPFLIFLLVFVLPLTSVVVTIFCQKKYIPIYVLATIGLCLIATINNFSDTLFYVIPALISGVVFGLLLEKKIPPVWIIFVSSLLTTGLSYAFVPLIELIYNQNIINVFLTIFKVNDFQYIYYMVPCFIYLISLIQSILSYIFIRSELPKLGIVVSDETRFPPLLIASAITLILIGISIPLFPELSYLFSMWLIYFSCYILINLLLLKKTYIYVVLGLSVIVTFVLFGTLFKSIPNPFGFLLIDSLFLLIICLGIVDNYLITNRHKVE